MQLIDKLAVFYRRRKSQASRVSLLIFLVLSICIKRLPLELTLINWVDTVCSLPLFIPIYPCPPMSTPIHRLLAVIVETEYLVMDTKVRYLVPFR